jgi:predicted transcriptional regulator
MVWVRFHAFCCLAFLAHASFAQEGSSGSRWSIKPGLDTLVFEGGDGGEAPVATSLALSYRLTDPWTADLSGLIVPYKTGSSADAGFGCAAELIYHLNRLERLDPYLACGAGYYDFPDPLAGPRAGLGILYHLTEQLACRVDTRATLSLEDGALAYQIGIGLAYAFGLGEDAPRKPALLPDGSLDSDRDSLSDTEESMRGTDPFKQDTDNDGLSDGEECKTSLTDPLNPDTDFDGLLDGEEVLTWKTNPLLRDSDNGGVDDWHELKIDTTNPCARDDDLFLIEIPATFEYTLIPLDDDVRNALDRLAGLLAKNPQAAVRIEAHIDRKMRADAKVAQALTEQYAGLAVAYLVEKGLPLSRLSKKGFGFARPKVQANMVRGNPENQRFELYVRGLPR